MKHAEENKRIRGIACQLLKLDSALMPDKLHKGPDVENAWREHVAAKMADVGESDPWPKTAICVFKDAYPDKPLLYNGVGWVMVVVRRWPPSALRHI